MAAGLKVEDPATSTAKGLLCCMQFTIHSMIIMSMMLRDLILINDNAHLNNAQFCCTTTRLTTTIFETVLQEYMYFFFCFVAFL